MLLVGCCCWWAAAVGGLLPLVGHWLWHRWAVDFQSAAAPVLHPPPQTPAVARLPPVFHRDRLRRVTAAPWRSQQ